MNDRKQPLILVITPEGVGGITSMAELIQSEWKFESPSLRLFRVPRNSFLGWIKYPISLISFLNVLVLNNVKMCHVNLSTGGSPLRKSAFIVVAFVFRVPVVIQVHSGKFDTVYQSPSTPRWWKWIVNLEFSICSGVISINKSQNDLLKSLIHSNNIAYLPNAIKLSKQDQIESKNTKKIFDFVFVGRFSEEKGAIDLLQTLKAIQSVSLSVAVVGTNESGFRESFILENLQPHRLIFFGQSPPDRVAEVMRQSKVLILPSHVENFPMVILEAYRASIPVIATSVGAVSEIVANEVTGKLVQVSNQIELRCAMMDYYLGNKDAITQGDLGFENTISNFNISAYPTKLLEIYSSFGIRFPQVIDK